MSPIWNSKIYLPIGGDATTMASVRNLQRVPILQHLLDYDTSLYT